MGSLNQAATLVASPSYPNSIAWSGENLVAVASGHLITILNPGLLVGPRGMITLSPSDPLPIGVVNREDLLSPCLMPTCLSRDTRPCARSISWSRPGFAPNFGCLLAVCTTDGHVKLYRPPFCELRDEWVEVADISYLLYKYYESTKFGEASANPTSLPQKQANVDNAGERGRSANSQEYVSCKGPGRRKRKSIRADNLAAAGLNASLSPSSVLRSCSSNETVEAGTRNSSVSSHTSSPTYEARSSRSTENGTLPLITAKQYAHRSAVLSSLVVAWSPALQSSRKGHSKCAILAVGYKSGSISFWRIGAPQCYTIEHSKVSVDATLIGLLQAHNSWITSIAWEMSMSNSSIHKLVLATGSSDGSVKIWAGDVGGLIQCTEMNKVSFSLLVEVTTNSAAPVSIISLVVPIRSQDKVDIAIGRGSGSIEVWACNLSGTNLHCARVYDAHDKVVTGLAWAFDGRCLYSCGQDNSIRSWISHGSHLQEVPFPSNFPGIKNRATLSQVSDQCFGVALAPGGLMLAVVRSFDANLLNQMYQARTQKAVVELFWTGGQLGLPLESFTFNAEPAASSESDLLCWGSNILWSLKECENTDKLLVLWDVVTALLTLKKFMPTFVEVLLSKWISSWFSENQTGDPIEEILSNVRNMLLKASSRKIHLLNIIFRRLNQSDAKAGVLDGQLRDPSPMNNEGKNELWHDILLKNERELQERLMAFTFAAVLRRAASSLKADNSWFPVGVAQMECWLYINKGEVQNQLKILGSKIQELGSRIHTVCEYTRDETCSFCSAPVQFESPDAAWCKGGGGCSAETHRLSRCAVSMRVCSIVVPLWHCCCCQRSIEKLPPEAFFAAPPSPVHPSYSDDESLFPLHSASVPLCPFCGIVLQRPLPDFLLSISPV